MAQSETIAGPDGTASGPEGSVFDLQTTYPKWIVCSFFI